MPRDAESEPTPGGGRPSPATGMIDRQLAIQARQRCQRCWLFGEHKCLLRVEDYARSGASVTEG